jgi:DNA segregation ATPase FtsK/SpoIIIE-like protein
MNEIDETEYKMALIVCHEVGFASTSRLQRRFRWGYTHAAQIVDAMVERGACAKDFDPTTYKRAMISSNKVLTGG